MFVFHWTWTRFIRFQQMDLKRVLEYSKVSIGCLQWAKWVRRVYKCLCTRKLSIYHGTLITLNSSSSVGPERFFLTHFNVSSDHDSCMFSTKGLEKPRFVTENYFPPYDSTRRIIRCPLLDLKRVWAHPNVLIDDVQCLKFYITCRKRIIFITGNYFFWRSARIIFCLSLDMKRVWAHSTVSICETINVQKRGLIKLNYKSYNC